MNKPGIQEWIYNFFHFLGSSGVSTPLSNSNRRSSLTFSPKRSVSNEDQAGSSPNQTATNSVERKTSFVTKTTVFLEPERKRSNAGVSGSNPAGAAGHLNLEIPDLNSERVKFDSSSLPTSPTSEEISTTSSVGGGMRLVQFNVINVGSDTLGNTIFQKVLQD